MRRSRSVPWGGILLVALTPALFCCPAHAARLDLQVGIGGAVVDGAFVMVQARVADVGFPFVGSVLLTQPLGNEWQGRSLATLRFPLTAARTGRIEWTVPLYDARQAMEATLFDRSGTAITSCTIDLRSLRRDEPFPVQVGDFAMPVAEDAVAIGPDELPTLWQSYEAIRSVWIGRVPGGIAPESWQALGRWVLAGGTLVVCTGEDFYLLETPVLDTLLPIAGPGLKQDALGMDYLAGDLQAGTQVLLEENGAPRLLERTYGAGRIVLVTQSALDVSPALWEDMRRLVTDAHLVSLSQATRTLSETMPYRRPSYLAAFALVAASTLVFPAVVLRVKVPKRRTQLLVAPIVALCLASGLYSIFANHVVSIYEYRTTLSVQGSLGITMLHADVMSVDGDPVRTQVRAGVPWIEDVPANRRAGRFDTETDLVSGRLTLSLDPGESRSLRSGGPCDPLVSLERTSQDEVAVLNRQAPLQDGILLVDGQTYRVHEIVLGVSRFSLDGDLVTETASLGGRFGPLVQALLETLPLEHGVWLIGFRESASSVRYAGQEKEVREVEATVVMGDDRA